MVSKRQQLFAGAGSGAWRARLWTALAWGAVGWSTAYWGLHLGGAALPVSDRALGGVDAPVNDARAVARALGGSDPAGQGMSAIDAMAARYRLLGVAVGDGGGRGSGDGLALISVDGQPGRPYHLGAMLPNGEQVLELAQSFTVLRLNDGQELRLQVSDRQTPLSSQSSASQRPPASSVSVDLPSNPVISMPAATQQAELQSQHETSDTSAWREEMRATVYANRLSRRSAEEQRAQTAP